ncbi:SusE domain-containing protein [Winogradskyella sp. 3972H.M.0a.05]|uniref:SusE domain-containing protein n=1 Tax=Winogradskyella sp. 3972H.M.0a.05 TaxID=2950277 RepID=UPI00339311DF
MKRIQKILTFSVAICMVAIFAVSCEDDSSVFTATETTPVVLSDLTNSMVELDAINTGNPAVTFAWTVADYGQPASENYAVEVSSDMAFTAPITATNVTGTNSVTLSMNELNSAVGAAGLPPFAWNTIYARVVSSIGTQNGLPVSSNVISFEVFPFFNYAFEDYYLVGNGTAADWNNNNNNPPLIRDAENSNLYRYTGFFTKGGGGEGDGRFKVLETRGLWQPQWGTTYPDGSDPIEASGGIAGNPGTQDSDPGRFGIEADGFYTFTVNFSDMSYTVEAFNATGAADYTSITLQGSGSTGGDVSMTPLAFDSHIWYAGNVSLAPGDLQFMTNTGSTWGGSTEFSGVATEGGSNIPVVVEDEYEVWFNDLTGGYIMIPLNL